MSADSWWVIVAAVIAVLGWAAGYIQVRYAGGIACWAGLHNYRQYLPSPRVGHGYQKPPPGYAMELPPCRVCQRCGHMPDFWTPAELEAWVHEVFMHGRWTERPRLVPLRQDVLAREARS